MKNRKSYLDERQEQVLLRIESRGFWLAYIVLLAAILVQSVITGFDLKTMAGEWISFLAICLYVTVACIRNGIWDRRIKPSAKNNVIASLIAGVAFGVITALGISIRFPGKPAGTLAAGVISGISVFVLCVIALTAAAAKVKKTQEALEAEEPEEDLAE